MVLLKDIDGVPSVPGNDVFSRRQQATVFVLTCAIPMTSYCKGDMRAFNGNKPTKQSKREQKMLLAREEERECYYEHVPVPEDKVAYGDKLRYALCNITPHTHARMHAPSLYRSIPYTRARTLPPSIAVYPAPPFLAFLGSAHVWRTTLEEGRLHGKGD